MNKCTVEGILRLINCSYKNSMVFKCSYKNSMFFFKVMALDDRCALDDGIPHQQVAGAMVNMYRMTEEFGKTSR